MTKKRMFEGTNLDNKIPKKADFQSTYDENFSELCTFYGLDAESLLKDKTSPWRELSHKLMEHLIPGFQRSLSGRRAKDTEFEKLIGLHLEVYDDFEDLTNPKKKELIKTKISRIAQFDNVSFDTVRGVRNKL